MDIMQIILLLTIGMLGLLTGYIVGRDKSHTIHSNQVQQKPKIANCVHETAVVRPDRAPTEGSLLVCEKCGSDFGNISTYKS